MLNAEQRKRWDEVGVRSSFDHISQLSRILGIGHRPKSHYNECGAAVIGMVAWSMTLYEIMVVETSYTVCDIYILKCLGFFFKLPLNFSCLFVFFLAVGQVSLALLGPVEGCRLEPWSRQFATTPWKPANDSTGHQRNIGLMWLELRAVSRKKKDGFQPNHVVAWCLWNLL